MKGRGGGIGNSILGGKRMGRPDLVNKSAANNSLDLD